MPLATSPASSTRAQKEWEQAFRALPDAKLMREAMQRLTAHPHHVGSPYGKDNAEWMLAKLKDWGLDAEIERFDVLFPTGADFSAARRAYEGLAAEGGGLKPDPEARPQAPGVEPPPEPPAEPSAP
jgi:hypothetical protein